MTLRYAGIARQLLPEELKNRLHPDTLDINVLGSKKGIVAKKEEMLYT